MEPSPGCIRGLGILFSLSFVFLLVVSKHLFERELKGRSCRIDDMSNIFKPCLPSTSKLVSLFWALNGAFSRVLSYLLRISLVENSFLLLVSHQKINKDE